MHHSPRRPRAATGALVAIVVVLTTLWLHAVPAAPDAIVAAVPVGEGPSSLAVNPATNKIYVANEAAGNVSVLDGSSSAVLAVIAVGVEPTGVAVNPDTNRVYVTNAGGASVTVIDGATDTALTTIAVGVEPFDVRVNRLTNRVYVADIGGAAVHVIDGSVDAVIAAIPVGANPRALAVNTTTNRVYVANITSASVSVIDGASSTVIATIPTGANPTAIALNESADRVYVANAGADSVSVIDGLSATATEVAVGDNPVAVAVNPTTDRAYVANTGSSSISIVDGATASEVGAIGVGATPVAVAVGTGSGRVVVGHGGNRTITVVDGFSGGVIATFTPATGSVNAAVINDLTNRAYVASERRVTVIDPALPTPTTQAPRPSTTREPTTSTTAASTTSTTRRTSTTSSSSTTTTSRPPGERPTASRTAGADRYATATQLTADLAPGVPLAFITTGESYPDALAVGPIAGIEDYALLVTKRNEVPAATAFELGRLKPETIVVVGGTGAISPAVEQQLQQYTDGFVLRVAGSSRYETAVALSRLEFVGADTVHIVSGEGFADAVSAGQAAGAVRGPVLLVTRTDVPDVVAEELVRLGPSRVVIGGGPAAVGPEVESEMRELLGNVEIVRAAGDNRFTTAVALAELAVNDATDTVYVATGLSFADALAATPATIRHDAPMVLVPSSGTVPAAVVDFVRRVAPSSVVVVGGTGAIPDAIVDQVLG